MHANPNEKLIALLRQKIHTILSPLIVDDNPFALLDFPAHPNVGDSAIWLGELAYFRQYHNARPAFVNHLRKDNLHQLNSILPKGTIFIHGGGNFGDLWSAHQKHRENVLQQFPDRKIIQLPQSIHFNSTDAIARSSAVINQHPDFTLLVRDQPSLDFAKAHYRCQVILCPDMALALGPLNLPAETKLRLLLLLRTDNEKANLGEANLPSCAVVSDWLIDDPSMQRKKALKYFFEILKLGSDSFHSMSRLETSFKLSAELRLMRGLKQLSSAEYVVTDRLHVHILSMLLGIPHTTLDNNYGKISRFVSAWTKNAVHHYETTRLDDALAHYTLFEKS